MSEKQGIYVFCGIQTDKKAGFGNVHFDSEDREIYTVHYKDAAMVVTRVPMKIYHPSKENLMMHQKVLSRVMETMDTVVPISFGNLFQSEEDVLALAESLYPQLVEIFPQIKGKIEVGLKVVGKKDWLEKSIKQNENVMKKKQIVHSKSEAAGYFDRIQLGEMAKDFFHSLQNDIKSEIHDSLSTLAEANQINDPIGEKMLLNAAYLIDSDKESQFDKKVNELHDSWQDKVDFKYTGPWPAYNFINIKLKIEEPST
ncbi:GvpL/GvpF family gas vesicle protein [Oceanobacillus sp. FSL K6-2867]|uniref:GvpL/GvpF family gas vesicle protein n=1 Tax=Oceanobacillus sp. FSL K6-2867 TaxID=2954748 RepID=UPI0030D7C01B